MTQNNLINRCWLKYNFNETLRADQDAICCKPNIFYVLITTFQRNVFFLFNFFKMENYLNLKYFKLVFFYKINKIATFYYDPVSITRRVFVQCWTNQNQKVFFLLLF